MGEDMQKTLQKGQHGHLKKTEKTALEHTKVKQAAKTAPEHTKEKQAVTKEKWYSPEETAHSWAKNVYEKEATKSQIAKNKDWGMYVDGPTATAEHFKDHWPDKNESRSGRTKTIWQQPIKLTKPKLQRKHRTESIP